MVVEDRDVDWREPEAGVGVGVTGAEHCPDWADLGVWVRSGGVGAPGGGPLGERDVELST